MSAQQHPRRPLPVFWIVVAVLVVAGIAALVLTADSGKSTQPTAPDYAQVDASDLLPQLPGNDGPDPAQGMTLPTITGTLMDGSQGTISADHQGKQLIVVMAHWCPHCQVEIPDLVAAMKDGTIGDDVLVQGISTAVGSNQPNYPPETWLERESWNQDTLIDDEIGSASEALGAPGFPLLVFVNSDGTIQSRYSGEIEADQLSERLAELT